MKVLFVGLSNKVSKEPFDISTNSGKIVHEIMKQLDCDCFLINLVSYAPLDNNNKLRYPTKSEILESLPTFISYINEHDPDIIVSFGNVVYSYLRKMTFIKDKLIKKAHPSYIYVYKKRDIDKYIKDVVGSIID